MTHVLVAAAAAWIVPAAIGLLLARILADESDVPRVRVPVGLGIGLGLTALTSVVSLELLGRFSALFEAVLLALVAAVAWRRRARLSSEAHPAAAATDRAGRILVVLLVAAAVGAAIRFGLATAARPSGASEAWSDWNLRARILSRAGSGWPLAFSPLVDGASEPTLLPFAVARGFWLGGSERSAIPIGIGALYAAATAILLHSALRHFRGRSAAALATLVLVCVPAFVRAAASQCADVPLAFYELATLVCLACHDEEPDARRGWLALAGLSAGLAAWTRPEGQLFAVGIILVRGVALGVRRDLGALRREALPFAAGLLPVAAVFGWLVLGVSRGPAAVGAHLFVFADPDRFASILAGWAHHAVLFDGAALPIVPVLAAYALTMGPDPARPRRILGTIAWAGTFVLAGASLGLSAGAARQDLVLTQALPSALFALFLVLRPPRDAQKPAVRTAGAEWPAGAWLAQGLRLAVSVLAGALVGTIAALSLPTGLSVETAVVGYPTWANFDIERYLRLYAVLVTFVPTTAFVVWVALERVTRAPLPRWLSFTVPAPPSGPPLLPGLRPARERLFPALRLAFVAATWAMVESAAHPSGRLPAALAGAIGLGFSVVIATAARLLGPRLAPARTDEERVQTVSAVLVALLPLGLGRLSAATGVLIESTGHVRPFPWLPPLPCIAASVALLAWVFVRLRRRDFGVERLMLPWVAGPVLCFVLFARLLGPSGPLDAYHEGEPLATLHALASGRFPFRDYVTTHGFLGDVFPAILGYRIEASRWAVQAGQALFDPPFFVAGLLLLAVTAFRGRWPMWILAFLLAASELIPHLPRLAFVPLVLISFATLVERSTRPRAIAFSAAALAHPIAMPESLTLSVACFAVLALFEATTGPARPLRERFERTIRVAMLGAIGLALFFGFLAWHGALRGFYEYYRSIAVEAELQAGIPMRGDDGFPPFWVSVVLPPVLAGAMGFWLAARIRARQGVPVWGWVMGAVALHVVLFYPKGILRADRHVDAPLTASAPLILFTLDAGLRSVERAFVRLPIGDLCRRVIGPHLPTWILVGVLLVLPEGMGPSYSSGFFAGALHPARDARLGYVNDDSADLPVLADVRRLIRLFPRARRTVFDFSDSPAIFGFLVPTRPVMRYIHVDLARREFAQRLLVSDLERSRPTLVAFCRSGWFCEPDGVPLMIRNHIVSRWVFERYRPWIALDRFIFLLRKDVQAPTLPRFESPVDTEDLAFSGVPCDWGYAPSFLPARPTRPGPPMDLVLSPYHRSRRIETFVVPPEARATGYGLLELTLDGARDDFIRISDEWPMRNRRRFIRLRTRPLDLEPLRVPVGACLQWWGYPGARLFLEHSPAVRVLGARLHR